MTVLEIVKVKTKRLTDLEPTDYDLAIDEVASHIKNYIHRDEIPEELTYTWANMSVDLLNFTYYSNKAPEKPTEDPEIDPALISSLKVGDVTISLGSGSPTDDRVKALKSHKAYLDEITMNYKAELNGQRRMVW